MEKPHKNVVGDPELLQREAENQSRWVSMERSCAQGRWRGNSHDGGNGSGSPVGVSFTQSISLSQGIPLQHWDESRTEISHPF